MEARRGPKPQHKPGYRQLCQLLREMREAAGLSQRDLAKKMRMSPSQVAKCELGSRRIDPLEFKRWCVQCGTDPAEAIQKV